MSIYRLIVLLITIITTSVAFAGELTIGASGSLSMRVNAEADVSKYTLKFDLSELPENCEIDLAYVVLNATLDETIETPVNLVVYPVSESWQSSEISLTSSTISYSEEYSCIGLTKGKDLQSIDFPITNMVKAWVDGSLENNGLIIMGLENADSALEISTDTPGVKAELKVFYSINDRQTEGE
ncbi:MAG: DNRLRE domain-containing protein [Candidatus Zixiibacteriota bacterium]